MEPKAGLTCIREYFGSVVPVGMDELKTLSKAERDELAEGAAKQLGLTVKSVASNGATMFAAP